MTKSASAQRKFYMHPPHRTVGVSGFASMCHHGDGLERWTPDEAKVGPRHISLVSRTENGRLAAIEFERILIEQGNLLCQHVSDAVAHQQGIADTDCVIVSGPGLQILAPTSKGTVSFLPTQQSGQSPAVEQPIAEVDIVAVARRHPILEGVGPFHSFCYPFQIAQSAEKATCLMVGETQGKVFPVAWSHEGPERGFCTLLGSTDDFRQTEFVRLVLNALDWVLE
jgi:hypothetical protein